MTSPQLRDDPAFCRVGDWFTDPDERIVQSKPRIFILEAYSPALPIADPGTPRRTFRHFESPDGPAWRRVE